ncbi:hypothetical protein R1sor_007174 [Riccia sorocarpa]|uniref:Reverse transcriptase domain-containing protein n=1 Tax=Riccia sorocarpa TaxID=122646 RepID=A0ABD3HQ58_9MARC
MEGRITGLRSEEGRTLVHQLFTDDIGVFIAAKHECLRELNKILDIYELASGAKVNLSKTLVMPLGSSEVPQWVREEGCEIAMAKKRSNTWGYAQESMCLTMQQSMSSGESQHDDSASSTRTSSNNSSEEEWSSDSSEDSHELLDDALGDEVVLSRNGSDRND